MYSEPKSVLLFFILAIFSSAQATTNPKNQSADSTLSPQYTFRQGAVDSSISYSKLDAKIDSLERELYKMQVHQGFFSNELEQQTALFSLIVAGLLALIGFVSYGGFKIEVKRLIGETKMVIQNQKEDFESYKRRMIDHEINIHKVTGEFYYANSEKHFKDGQLVDAFALALRASYHAETVSSLLNDGEKIKLVNEFTTKTLDKALGYLKEMMSNSSHKDEIAKRRDSLFDMINLLAKSNDQNIVDLSAEIRVSIKSYLHNDRVLEATKIPS